MIRTFILSIILLFSQMASAQRNESDVFDTGYVSFEMVKNAIVIPVQIGGNTYRFVLDTGGVLMIFESLQNEMNFSEVDKIDVSDIGKNTRSFERVLIPDMSIGKGSFKNRKAIVAYNSDTYPDKCFGTHGLIGRDFFEGKILEFDYANRRIRISNQKLAHILNPKYKTRLKISDRGLPDVFMTIDDKEQYIEFDSGSGDLFSYQSKQAKSIKGKSEEEKLVFSGIFSFGVSKKNIKATKRFRIKIDELKIASTIFKNFYSDFTKPSAPRIGARILYHGKVIVDYKNLDFYYEPYKQAPELQPLETFGFDVAFVNNEYIVKWVLDGSEAEKSGLKYGSKILSINGKPLPHDGSDCNAYINGHSFHQLDKVTLTFLDRKSKTRSVQLVKKTY